jgi:predicted  nucleic acid-binding Zn-ribbon protein
MMSEIRHYLNTTSATSNPAYYTTSVEATKNSWQNEATMKEKVQSSMTPKQKKMIKDEIKIWMDDHFQKSLRKEAGKLIKDIENLKEEKTRLGKAISSLKQEMRQTHKDVRAEMKSMEEMLENYANKILRYQNLDL